MKIEVIDEPEYQLVKIEGDLDAASSVKLDNALQKILESHTRILIDFSDLSYISSSGIGLFTSRIGEIQQGHFSVVLFGMQEKVFSVFKILGLHKLLPIADTIEQAKVKLNEFQNNH